MVFAYRHNGPDLSSPATDDEHGAMRHEAVAN
jgi:hypothetical protein